MNTRNADTISMYNKYIRKPAHKPVLQTSVGTSVGESINESIESDTINGVSVESVIADTLKSQNIKGGKQVAEMIENVISGGAVNDSLKNESSSTSEYDDSDVSEEEDYEIYFNRKSLKGASTSRTKTGNDDEKGVKVNVIPFYPYIVRA